MKQLMVDGQMDNKEKKNNPRVGNRPYSVCGGRRHPESFILYWLERMQTHWRFIYLRQHTNHQQLLAVNHIIIPLSDLKIQAGPTGRKRFNAMSCYSTLLHPSKDFAENMKNNYYEMEE